MELLAEASDLRVTRGGRTVFAGVSFHIPADGRVTAIIGPNGSGKSTLLHLLVGLIRPVSGQIRVFGKRPVDATAELAYVLQHGSQESVHAPMTVREAVRMGRYRSLGLWRRPRAQDREAVDEALERMGLTELADRQIHELSGGQRQRMLVAQGLAQTHRALLLDEPLTGLDVPSAKTIDSLIHGDRADGTSVVHTTHDLDEARSADHVVLVGQQEVVGCGPPQQVCSRAALETAFGLGALHDWHGFLPHEHGHDPNHAEMEG